MKQHISCSLVLTPSTTNTEQSHLQVGEGVNSQSWPPVTCLLQCSPKGSIMSPKWHHQQVFKRPEHRWQGHFSFTPPWGSWTALSGQFCKRRLHNMSPFLFLQSADVAEIIPWEGASSHWALCLLEHAWSVQTVTLLGSVEMSTTFSIRFFTKGVGNTVLSLSRECLISLLWDILQCYQLTNCSLRGCLLFNLLQSTSSRLLLTVCKDYNAFLPALSLSWVF